jgi:mannonate dehydratase
MHRRDWLKSTMLGSAAAGLPWLAHTALAADDKPASIAEEAARGTPPLRITDVKTFLTSPAKIRLVVVKVLTNEPGLYGLGCATFTQRARAVETAVDKFLKPFLIGKDATRIDDIWQSAFVSSYWRNGPVLGNALSGVDMALWDILGKRVKLPLYQLLGGKCREAVDTYRHASGKTFQDVEEAVGKYKAEGYRHIRIQCSVPGLATYGTGGATGSGDDQVQSNRRVDVWEPGPYARLVPKLFEHIRNKFGDDIELLHDIHERVPPILAMQLVKDVEKFKPYFMEDPFSPEDVGYFKTLRQQTSTPLAMGELFNNPNEWVPLISERLIDFIRIHISQVGGLTMARKSGPSLPKFWRATIRMKIASLPGSA